LLRRNSFPRGRLLHLLTVLVHAGHEQSIITVEPFETRDRIGRNPLIGVPDMRRAIGIRNRGRDIKLRANRLPSRRTPNGALLRVRVQRKALMLRSTRSLRREAQGFARELDASRPDRPQPPPRDPRISTKRGDAYRG
jgi:hypothetical protein